MYSNINQVELKHTPKKHTNLRRLLFKWVDINLLRQQTTTPWTRYRCGVAVFSFPHGLHDHHVQLVQEERQSQKAEVRVIRDTRVCCFT